MTDKDSESGKKRLTVRATPEQLAILKCAFMHSAATPKDVLKRLSDETGLSTKWIVAWFTRQRRKRARDSNDTCLDPAMSPEEIANFKTEYREPELQISVDTIQPSLPISEKRNVDPPPKTKRRGRPPKPKVKAEHNDGENTLASNQPSSPSSVLLTIRPILPVSDKDVCNSMRSIAPRMHLSYGFQPHQMPLSFAAVSNSHNQPDLLNSSVGLDALNYNYFPGIVRYSSSENQDGSPHSIQSPEPRFATIQDENYPLSRTGYLRRSAAPRSPYPYRTAQWPSRMPVTPLAKLPLFTHNVLPFPRSLTDPDNNTTIMENVTSGSKTPHDSPTTNPYTSLPDSTKAPFKHLTIFQPTHVDYTEGMSATFHNMDSMVDRLLDEKLAVDDPFQATMGLVFLSRLGLEWDCE